MSSISLSLKMMLAASACAGLTLLACGGDDSGGGSTNNDDETPTKDAGKGKDAGKADAGKKDAGLATVTPGDDCDPEAFNGLGGPCKQDECDSPPCISQCVDGVYDECKSATDLIGQLAGDGGLTGLLRDSGFSLPDTGIKRTDAGLTIPVGDGGSISLPATECPTELTCSGTVGSIIGMPDVKLCADPSNPLGAPPTCTDTAACKAMGLEAAQCQMLPIIGSVCFQICK